MTHHDSNSPSKKWSIVLIVVTAGLILAVFYGGAALLRHNAEIDTLGKGEVAPTSVKTTYSLNREITLDEFNAILHLANTKLQNGTIDISDIFRDSDVMPRLIKDVQAGATVAEKSTLIGAKTLSQFYSEVVKTTISTK